MKRLVFTIVAGFIGGSRHSDQLVPLQPEDAARAGERSQRSARRGAAQAEVGQQDGTEHSAQGTMGASRGLA